MRKMETNRLRLRPFRCARAQTTVRLATFVAIAIPAHRKKSPSPITFTRDTLSTGPTGALLEAQIELLSICCIDEQGPVRDFIKGDIRADVEKWSAWSPGVKSTPQAFAHQFYPVHSYMQFRVFFNGDAENAIRIDTLLESFPKFVSTAIGEIALASNLQPANGMLQISGVGTTFVYDLDGVCKQRTGRLSRHSRQAFPAPTFWIYRANPLTSVADVNVTPRERGFDVFPPVSSDNNQPLRVYSICAS